ncbi:RNA-binding protein 25 isoform X1 [Ricinus communis]|uniref:RNA-binding protein 25 isoform X1 n=1 Tax=Ricinus communis TaxID=3988 RepID=UPI00201A3C0D|nr:RNA-binding protein 25 isoform X1 [Ricinus communis]XP_048232969.1 RNA-binding protein 25 isoform X1 [Ricinus communis]XP_048232970.1 RNA-binding protein 25 isoform X1 [Ricinus communis]
MSRCFPFPRPGYEKKPRTDDTDLLKKEKNKEKKRKKDKKEKEKREGKEKRDKDRGKEKNREKKDQKENHKDKGRDKDKEKKRTSDEKKVEGQPGSYNGENFGSNSLQNGVVKDSIYVEELARRIRIEDGASGSKMVEKFVATDQRRGEVRGMVVERSVVSQSQEKEKVKHNNEDHGKVNGQRHHIDTRGLEKAFIHDFFGTDQERVKGLVKLVEKKETEKQMEGKEKNKHKESGSKGDKHKIGDRENNRKSKDKDRDKVEKKEKTKEITESSKEQPKLKENVSKLKEGSKDSLDFRNTKSEILNLSNVGSAVEGNLGKRKEPERNGYLLDNGNWPNKFPRPVSSSHPATENGKKLEPCRTATQFISEKQWVVHDHKLDMTDKKINGLITAEQKINGLVAAQPRTSSIKSLSVCVPAIENGETLSKPPHPDTKYLNQIISIPEMEERLDVDDQEWLLSCNHLLSKKQREGSAGIVETRQGTPTKVSRRLGLEIVSLLCLFRHCMLASVR